MLCKKCLKELEELSDESVAEIITNLRWEKTKKFWRVSNKKVSENEM